MASAEQARAIPAICGILAGPALAVGTLVGAAAQPDEFSLVNDPPSDLGASTAASPWIANQIGSNLAGVLLRSRALALAWSPFFGADRLRPLWPSRASASSSPALYGSTAVRSMPAAGTRYGMRRPTSSSLRSPPLTLLLAPFVVARALKLTQHWHDLWLPTLAFAIGTVVAGLVGSALGGGLGSLLAALVWFAWIAMLAVRMLRQTRTKGIREATDSARRLHRT